MRGSATIVQRRLAALASDKFPSNPLSDLVNLSASERTSKQVNANPTPHTWGTTYVEIDPSLSDDCDGIAINMQATTGTNATNTSTLIRIYTGAGGAETTWATAAVGYRSHAVATEAEYGSGIFIPGRITSGTRVSFRAQSAVGSKTAACFFTFLRSDKTVDFGSPVSMCFDTATSKGVDLTAPGSLNTKSEWTELVASTSQAFTALAVFPQGAGSTDLGGNMLVDIGTGTGGAETVLIPDIGVHTIGVNDQLSYSSPLMYGVDIPAGTRIVGRYQRSNATGTVDLCLVGA